MAMAGPAARGRKACALLAVATVVASAQARPPQTPHRGPAALDEQSGKIASASLDNCGLHRVTTLPGSHQFAGDFIEALATDPSPADEDRSRIWALTADLSELVPAPDRAMYISTSGDGGATWTEVARLDSRYFEAAIGEGLRNGLSVSPGGQSFVVTTQLGAFQVVPQQDASHPLVKPIDGPRVPQTPARLPIAKKPGDPVRANAVQITASGNRLIVGYGYFDREPQLWNYRKAADGSWIEDAPLPPIPTAMDVLSMQFDDPANPDPGKLYVGTGDQAYVLDLRTRLWSRIEGVGADSAIHGMSVVGGLHLAACWGVYNPVDEGTVWRVVNARFLLHRNSDESGSNLRAYSIDVDPAKPAREVVTSLTGVYTTENNGETWRRLNGLPEEEFRTGRLNPGGTILVSGIAGTFLVNPFSKACLPSLKSRRK